MKKTYYKGCMDDLFKKDRVIKDYVNGVYFDNNLHCKVNIQEGVTKYNVSFIKDINVLMENYTNLIILDSIVLSVIEENVNKDIVYGIKQNIFRLQHAQGGTIKWFRVLKKALSTYAIKKQDIYNAINKDIKIAQERLERNKSLLYEICIDFGLGPFIYFIEQEKGISIFEDINNFIENNIDILRDNEGDKKDRYENLANKYKEYVLNLAKEHNLDIMKNISETAIKHYEYRQAISKELESKHKEENLNKKIELAKRRIEQLNVDLYNSIVSANENKFLSDRFHSILTERIENLGGVVYYIVGVKSNVPYYFKEDLTYTTSIVSCKFYKDKETANKIKDDIYKTNQNFIVLVVEEIKLPALITKNIQTNLIEEKVKKLQNTLVPKDINYSYEYIKDYIAFENGIKILGNRELEQEGIIVCSINKVTFSDKYYVNENEISNSYLGAKIFNKRDKEGITKAIESLRNDDVCVYTLSVFVNKYIDNEVDKYVKENIRKQKIKQIKGNLLVTNPDKYIIAVTTSNRTTDLYSDTNNSGLTQSPLKCSIFNSRETCYDIVRKMIQKYLNRYVSIVKL